MRDDAVASRPLQSLLRSGNFEPVIHSSRYALHDAGTKLWAGCILIHVRDGQKSQTRLGALHILPTIVLGRAGNIQAAVSPMKQGAFNFLEKFINEQVPAFAIDAALRTSVHISGTENPRRHSRMANVGACLVRGAFNLLSVPARFHFRAHH